MGELLDGIRKRPLMWMCAAFLCMLLPLRLLTLTGRIMLTAAVGFGIVLLLAVQCHRFRQKAETGNDTENRIRDPHRVLLIPLCAAMFACAVSLVYYDLFTASVIRRYAGREVETEFVITGGGASVSWASYAEALVLPEDGLPFRARVELLGADIPETGERWRGIMTFSEFPEYSFTFRERLYYTSRGLILKGETHGALPVGGDSLLTVPLRLLGRMRSFCELRLEACLSRSAAGFGKALLLGERKTADPLLRRDMERIGLSHMLAVSGMHLTIVTGGASVLLGALGVDRRKRVPPLILLAIAYAALTGFSSSVTRALVMFIMSGIAMLSGSRNDEPTSLFFTAALICLVNPAAVTDASLLLSFTATLGIITFGKYMTRRLYAKRQRGWIVRTLRTAAAAFLISLAAMLFTLPVSWVYFGSFSPWSPLTTPLFSLPVTLFLGTLPLIVLFGAITPISVCLGAVAETMYLITSWAVSHLAGLPFAVISLRHGFVRYILILTAAAFIILYLARVRKFRAYAAAGAVGLTALAVCLTVAGIAARGSVRMVYASSGSGDCITTVCGDTAVLCDLTEGSYSIASATISAAAEELNITELNAVILTSYNHRTVSQLNRLLSEIMTMQLLLPIPADNDDESTAAAASDTAQRMGVQVLWYMPGEDAVSIGGLDIIVKLSEIGRSARVCRAVSLDFDGGCVLYSGSSFCDSPDASFVTSKWDSCDALIFGACGPVMKYAPLYSPGEISEIDTIIYANDKLADIISPFMPEKPKRITLGGSDWYTVLKFPFNK